MNYRLRCIPLVLCAVLAGGCAGEDEPSGSIPATSSAYIVLAWNDLGMHCLSPGYDTAVILPPYNTLMAQVIKRGNKPQVVTSGVTVEYRIINNTSSSAKGLFGQFWAYAQKLFGAAPADNKGLTGNGLSGTMAASGTHFEVIGIPVVPIDDSGVKNPYQVAEITVKDTSGTVLAQTRATVPTSDEINCGKCHAAGGTVTQVFNDILSKHDSSHGTSLMSQKPVLCASCHGSPALGTSGAGSSGKYLSQAIHRSHSTRGAACYDCHPGANTKCSRSASHTAADGNCVTCHGDMSNVAATIVSGRVPWTTEPKCVTCHSGIAQVDTGATLYRNAAGHGGVYCAGCHGSPHAMYPVSAASQDATGNYQPLQYQQKAMVLGDCRSCHKSSRGGGNNFAEEHSGKTSACNVCHTGFQNAGNTANWPHQFQWKSR